MSDVWGSVQDWAIGIDRRIGSLALLGIVLGALIVGAVGAVFALFTGHFTKYDSISVRLPVSSTAALPGSSVQFRDVSIGQVVSQGRPGPDGTTVVEVHIKPGQLKSIPASVTASVTPISVFGNQYIVLVPPTRPGNDTLKPGALVRADQNAQGVSVQQTITSIDGLLTKLHPAELNVALTAVARALQGQGAALGQTSALASAYLGQIQPLWPQIVAGLNVLSPVADEFTKATPDVVAIFGNQITTANTITQQSQALNALLRNSGAFADQATALNDAIATPYQTLAAASSPFLDSISQRPDNVSRLLDGLTQFAKSVTQAGQAGPFLTVTTNLRVQNTADVALAGLGGDPTTLAAELRAGLGPQLVNPAPYTAGQRPSFPAAPLAAGNSAIPGLGSPSGAAAQAAAALTMPVVPAQPADQERTAIATITSAISGADPASGDAAALLLSPLLVSLSTR